MTISPRRPSREDSAYRYDEEAVHALRGAISEERFATYLALAGDDDSRALQPRGNVHDRLNRLRTLQLRADHDGILGIGSCATSRSSNDWLLDRLSPEMAAWVEHHSRVRETLALSSHRMRRF